MTCEQDHLTLAAYMDGELTSDRAAKIEQHIRTCPRCSVEIARFTSMRRGLSAARERYAPSAEFRAKIQSQVRVQRARPRYWRFAGPAIAVAVLILACVVWLRKPNAPNVLSEVADLHVNALASTNPVDVISTDRHTVKPWFQGRIPFSFNVPEFAGTDFSLMGGRVVYLQQQPGAQLIVALHQHKISVLILQDSPELEHSLPRTGGVHQLSFNIDTLQSHNLRFFVIGDTQPSDIETLSHMFQTANP